MERMEAIVISTAHVPQDVAEMLDNTPVEKWPVSGFKGPYGWIIYAHDEDVADDIHPALMKVFSWARREGFSWVRFDGDANHVSCLPAWEW